MNEKSPTSTDARRLEQVNARIRAHPLNSERFTKAREVARITSDQGLGAVDTALREQDLPSRGAQTRMLVLGLTSLARLNRKRIKLERRIDGTQTE